MSNNSPSKEQPPNNNWMLVIVVFMMFGLYEYSISTRHYTPSAADLAAEAQSNAQLEASTRRMFGAIYDSDESFCSTVRKYMGQREATKTARCWGPQLSREEWITLKMQKESR